MKNSIIMKTHNIVQVNQRKKTWEEEEKKKKWTDAEKTEI